MNKITIKIQCIMHGLGRHLAKSRLAIIWVVLLSTVWFGIWEWCRPLMVPDEGRYIGVAWEMLRQHEFWTPTLNGLPYFHKPPLFYWLSALFMSIFGLHEWVGRLPSLIGAVLGIVSMFIFVRRWQSRYLAWCVLWLMLIQPLIFLGSQYANLDMLVAGCMTATILSFAHAVLLREYRLNYKYAVILGYTFAGLGFLAKGLIGLVLPAGVMLVWLISLRQWRHILPILRCGTGWILLLVIILPWVVVMQFRYSDFLYYFIIVQHFQRFAQAGFNNVQPMWFYPAILIVAGLPFWIAIVKQIFTRREQVTVASPKPKIPSASTNIHYGQEDNMQAKLELVSDEKALVSHKYAPRNSQKINRTINRLMWVWLIVITVFFSLPKSKLVGYIFPVSFAMSYLFAWCYVQTQQRFYCTQRRRLWLIVLVAYLCLDIIVATVPAIIFWHGERGLAQQVQASGGQGIPTYMVGHYYFSVPFYAKLKSPIYLVDDWNNPDILNHDNARKEIADAGEFDLKTADKYLIPYQDFKASICQYPVVRILANENIVKQYPFLQYAHKWQQEKHDILWILDTHQASVAQALQCSASQ